MSLDQRTWRLPYFHGTNHSHGHWHHFLRADLKGRGHSVQEGHLPSLLDVVSHNHKSIFRLTYPLSAAASGRETDGVGGSGRRRGVV
eukprot:410138-Rhodomonas_salina.1